MNYHLHDYTGDCNITRMVWNIEDTKTWHKVRFGLLNPKGKEKVEFTDEDIEALAMDMVRCKLRIFSIMSVGRKIFIRSVEGEHSWDEFCRSWAAAVIGSGHMHCRIRSRAAEMNVIMRHLSPDFEVFHERMIVAQTMLIAKTGLAAA